MACDYANRDGWTGFYGSGPLSVSIYGQSRAHPVIADYGLERSALYGQMNPDDNAPAWCALPNADPAFWGARAYLLKPESGGCFAPAQQSPFWETPAVPHRLAKDFAQFSTMGDTIRFTVDLHRVGCGALLTVYMAGLPAVDAQFRYDPQQPKDEARNNPGCAGRMYYADANPEMTGCSSYGLEFDLFEGNVESMHSTAHGCVSGLDVPGSRVKSGFAPPPLLPGGGAGGSGSGSSGWFGRVDQSSYPDPAVRLMHNRICDGDGTGVGVAGTGVRPLGKSSHMGLTLRALIWV